MSVHRRGTKLLACLAIVFAARAAGADDRKWEVEAHGGLVAPTQSTGGTVLLGDPGAPLSSVPTWYFGQGGVLLGQMARAFRLSPPGTLDGALKTSFAERRSGVGFGFRAGRTLTPRWSLELSFDEGLARTRVNDSSRAAIDAASGSFTSVFNALLSLPGRNASVTSVPSFDEGRGRQVVTTGAVAIHLLPRARLTPFATVGAGAAMSRDESVDVRLVGSYQFGIPLPPGLPVPVPSGQFHETDTVTVRTSRGNAFTGLFGGGVKYALAERWGMRFDLRDYISPNRATTLVAATPTTERNSSFMAVTTFGFLNGPSIQVSTVPGIPSTLSGRLPEQVTFRGSGVVHQINASVGVYWRF